MKKQSAKILIIDDTPSIIDFIKDALLKEGYKIFMAISGEKGLEIANQVNPDIILLDVLMPGINGFETCYQLKEKITTKDIPVIFMSALGESIDKIKAFNAGAIDYLTKPVNKEELIIRIQTHLAAIHKVKNEREELQQVNSSIIKFLGEIIYNYDIFNDQFIWSNDISEILGYSENQVQSLFNDLLGKVHPNHQELFKQQFKQTIQTGVPAVFDFQLQSDEGKYIWFQNRSNIIFDKDKKPLKIIGIFLNMTFRKEQEQNQLQAIVKSVDLERKRIATEIHDGLGQTLIAANLILSSIDNSKLDDSIKKQATVSELIDEAIVEGREIAHNLMPKSLDDYGLIASLKSLINRISGANAMSIKFHCNKTDEIRFPTDVEVNLYRISQEALSNIIKHSEAQHVILQLIIHQKSIILTIEDDGIGIEQPSSRSVSGLGIENIKNRVASINGMIQIDSNPQGTNITVEVNLA
jgi:PAS domain S-box-containing protein